MAKDLLWEIGLEEMPSSVFPKLIDDFQRLATDKFTANGLGFTDIKVWGTPRRLILYIRDLADKQPDSVIENRGPKQKIAFDENGNPSRAVLGFAKGQGVDIADLVVKEVKGEDYMFVSKKVAGQWTSDIAANLLLEIFHALPLPKSMRWGSCRTRFVRPIRWMLAFYGADTLNIQIENIVSGQITYGHRFLSTGALKISSISDYFKVLRQNYVILDQNERKNMIAEQIETVAAQVGGQAYHDEELLNENTYLLEYPYAFFGNFSSEYLNIPVEVLTTSMITNQRYFPVFDQNKNLLPGFIALKNGTEAALDNVRNGNERVLKARLEDALFFWQEDIAKSLEAFVPDLAKVTFHEKLGSMLDKTERLGRLALYLGEQLRIGNPADLQRAAYLSKADLQTKMVYEFGELQGVMGYYYAANSGEETAVAVAIKEHYQPRFSEDELPGSATGIALSLSDKLDNLTGFFALGIKPSGSQDPYALRRQALGIANIILQNQFALDLKAAISFAYQQLDQYELQLDVDSTVNDIMQFIILRLRGIWLEQGLNHDIVDAVLAVDNSDLTDLQNRLQAVSAFLQTDNRDDFMVVFNRSNNLTKKWEPDMGDVNAGVLADPSEKRLYMEVNRIQVLVQEYMAHADYQAALAALAELRPVLDEFFTAVMVMAEDDNLRRARLGLLKTIADLARNIADFSLLQL